MRSIPIAGPWITEKEIACVADAAGNAWYESAGTFNQRFERDFARHTGRDLAIALPSCTAGLHLVLAALGVGPGDEVIVPDLTWIATSAPISYLGATPVFADVERDTWCLSAESVRAVATERTKAVIAVDLYGGMPDYTALVEATDELGIALIEDAAEAVGASWNGGVAGSFGVSSVFSFHGSKTLTTGEGGMAVTSDPDLHSRMRVLADHGRAPGDTNFFNQEVAYKYKMSSLQAALGIAQLERVGELVARKREIFTWYGARLSVPSLALNPEPAGSINAYWMTTVLWDAGAAASKTDIREQLQSRGVQTRPFFHPLSSLPAYRDTPQAAAARERNTVSYDISPRGLNLPSALSLTEQDVAYVCDELHKVLGTDPVELS
jgi:perosamine synthetase